MSDGGERQKTKQKWNKEEKQTWKKNKGMTRDWLAAVDIVRDTNESGLCPTVVG